MLPEKIDPDIANDAVVDGTSADSAPQAPEPDTQAESTVQVAESAESAVDEVVVDEVATLPTEEIVVAPAQVIKPAAAKPAADDPHHWDGPSIPFVPHHAIIEGVMAMTFMTVVLIMVALMPAPLEGRANPFLSPEGVKPEWYFMAPFELLHLLPPLIGMLVTGAAVGVLIMWPFVDRKPRRITRRPFMMALSFAIILVILGLTIYPYMIEG
jgi:hypothetical protein